MHYVSVPTINTVINYVRYNLLLCDYVTPSAMMSINIYVTAKHFTLIQSVYTSFEPITG